jgi:hypothetical protein
VDGRGNGSNGESNEKTLHGVAAADYSLKMLIAMFAVALSGLTYTAPPAWHSRPPASSMRVAEFVVPKAQGDSEDAELIIHYFGAAGAGSAEANIDRWISQVKQPDGSPSKAKVRRADRMINGLKVTTVDVTGTFTAEMSPGAAEHYNKPAYRLCAAVVETPQGPYYIKMTGPAKTVADAQPDYEKFLSSLKFQ